MLPRGVGWLGLSFFLAFGCATAGQAPKPAVTEGSAIRPHESPAGTAQLVPFHGEGGFTILMPPRPYQTERTENTPGGPVYVHLTQVRDEMAKYLASVSEFPEGSLDRVPRKDLLESLQQSTIDSMRGTLVTSHDIDVAGMPGREFTATDSEGSEVTARIVIGDSRVYTLAGTYPQGTIPVAIRQFLDSFQAGATALTNDAASAKTGNGSTR